MPGLYYYVLASDIERFADEVQTELGALGPYFMYVCHQGIKCQSTN